MQQSGFNPLAIVGVSAGVIGLAVIGVFVFTTRRYVRAVSNKPQDAESKQPDSSFIQLDDVKQKGAASAASAPRRKALVGALTAV